MALWADDLAKNHSEISHGRWAISRPIPGPFWSRVKDVWLVIRGKAEAVRFHVQGGWQQPPRPWPAPPARAGRMES